MLRYAMVLLCCVCCAGAVFGQFADDFSDGNLANPDWQGDAGHFEVTSGQLHLNAPQGGTSTLYLKSAVPDSAEWQLYFKMDFAPSDANRLTIYFLTGVPDGATGEALYLTAGENGTDDALRIYERHNGTVSQVASSPPGSVATAPVELRLRLELVGGQGRLSVDWTGGHNFQTVAVWNASVSWPDSSYFVLRCDYSATRKDKFYFDDIALQAWQPDQEPPQLLSAFATDSQTVRLQFNEWLAATAPDPATIEITPGIGHPADVDFVAGDSAQLNLFLAQDLVSGTHYTIQASQIADRAGNSTSVAGDFIYVQVFPPEPFDLVISEIFPDPVPSVGLPESEFVEILNRSDKAIDLAGVKLRVNATSVSLPSYLLLPDSMIIVTDMADVPLWQSYGPVLGVNLPTLTNNGGAAGLTYNGSVLYRMDYTTDTYGSAAKAGGGWTLELINPQNPCLGDANWRASEDWAGGTPGHANSVLDTTIGGEALTLETLYPLGADQILLRWDQWPGPEVTEVVRYSLQPPVPVTGATPDGRELTLSLGVPLAPNDVYVLTIQAGIANCIGNQASQMIQEKIGLPAQAEAGDVLVNEILFDPVSGGSDYVELYNASDKIIDLPSLVIANPAKMVFKPVKAAGLLFPRQYVCLTPAPRQVRMQYEPPDSARILANDLPAFPNDSGRVAVIQNGVVLDSMTYSADMHLYFATDVDGVALERISPSLRGPSAWVSAAATTHYGTPGYVNSQYLTGGDVPVDDYVRLAAPTFSPDGDGYQDFLAIRYKLPKAGFVLRATIWDVNGHYITAPANGNITGTEGVLQWDGTDTKGRAVPEGYTSCDSTFFIRTGTRSGWSRVVG